MGKSRKVPMTALKSKRIRKSLVLAVLMASCLQTPSSLLPPSQRLELRESASGPLGKAPFAVVAAGPRGEIAIGSDPGITIVFNRAMRRIDAPLDSGLPAVKVRTAAGQDVPGAFRFVGTRGLLFKPSMPLLGANRFVVTVPRGTKSVDGSTLSADYAFEFTTDVVRLLASFPATRPIRENEPIYLKFTQPVDPEEVTKHIELNQEIPGQKQTRTLALSVQRGAPVWFENESVRREGESEVRPSGDVEDKSGKWLKVVPASPLPFDSHFKLVVKAGLPSLEGPLVTPHPFTVEAKSIGPLYVTNLKCAKLNLGRCQAHRDFTAVFSNPVHSDEFRRYLRIEGPTRRAKPVTFAQTPKKVVAQEHQLGLEPEYGDHFRITLQKGMTDVFGQKLVKDVPFDLSIEEPFVKLVTLPKLKANREACDATYENNEGSSADPNALVRETLQYGLELGISGHIIEANALRTGARERLPHIPISAINVPTYGLNAAALTEWSTIQWLNDASRPSTFRSFTWVTPHVAKNTRSVRSLELENVLDHHPTGTAVVSLLGVGQLDSQDTVINVTDLGLSAKMSKLGSLVWVTRLSTGKGVGGASVSVYGSGGDTVAQVLTDDQGVASFSAEQLHPINKQGGIQDELLLVARANDDYTYQRLSQARGALVPSGVDYQQKSNWVGLVFTDRSVYRPGETVKAGGFFRRTAETGFSVTPKAPYQYQVSDSTGEVIAVGENQVDDHGALAADIALGKAAAFGRANLTVKFGRHYDEQFSVPFEILAYKPAEFKVEVDPLTQDVVHWQSASFKVRAEYLFGSKLSEGKVAEHVSRNEVSYVPPQSTGYIVEDSAYLRDLRFSTNRGSAYRYDTKTLDENGELAVTVALDAPEQSKPELLTLEAEVQDLSAQTQAARASVMVHPAQYYVGLKVPQKRFLATGATLPVDVTAFRPGGKKVGQIPVQLELLRRNWMSALEDRPTDLLYHRTYVRDEKRGECQVVTERAATDCVLRLTEPGYYILRASLRDELGNRAYASFGVYATSDQADSSVSAVAWNKSERRELALELDQLRYQPFDTAKVLVKNPFQEATALVTVERGGILWRKVVNLRGKMPVLELPVLASFFPNAFVSVHLLRGRVAPVPEPGKADVGAPDYRVGYAELFVDPESHRLNIGIKTSTQQYLPGDEVDTTVTLTRKDGRPLSGTVTFYVVDEGVLRLTGYKTPDPLPAFAGPRRLGVFALESRDNLARIIHFKDGERISPLGFETASTSSGDKGYEGGGGGDLPGKIRSDFRSTVYFKAGQSVGKDGATQFKFKLPDNLTSYRLMAVAAAEEDRFGFGEATITSNRSLMARPALPRRLRVGDQLQAGVVVTSKGIGPVMVDVAMKAKGLSTNGLVSQRVALAANGQAKLNFPVKVDREGDVSFEFGVKAGSHSDRVLLKRHVEQPIRWLTATTYGTTDKPVAIALGDLRGYLVDRGELNVGLSNSALVGLKTVFDSLSNYPYGCTEQLTSRVLPLLLAPKLAELEKVRFPSTQREDVDAMLSEIVKRVRDDGYVSFWEGDTEASAWLTAYALLALEQGSKDQYFIPKRTRDQVSNRLLQWLDGVLSEGNRWQNGEDDEGTRTDGSTVPVIANDVSFRTRQFSPTELHRRELAQAVFVADVLARTGQLDGSRLRRLGVEQEQMALSSKIQLLHAMAVLRFPRQELDKSLQTIVKTITVGPAEARVELSDSVLVDLLESATRSTAHLLEAVLAIDKKHPLAPKLTQGLLRLKQGNSYRNTQEEAWVLLALEEYRKAEAANLLDTSVQVVFGDQLKGSFAFREPAPKRETVTIPASVLLTYVTSNLGIAVEGKGRVSYAVELKLAKSGASNSPIDEGLSVEKLQRPVDSTKLQEVAKTIAEHGETRANVGQLVLVDLLLETSEARERVVIDDPMPAGFEPVEFAFVTTTQALSVAETVAPENVYGKLPEDSLYGTFRSMNGVHREMHDDRVLYFIPHVEPGIYHLRYLARATSSGKFVVPPTRATCMYEPSVFGQTNATEFEITSSN